MISSPRRRRLRHAAALGVGAWLLGAVALAEPSGAAPSTTEESLRVTGDAEPLALASRKLVGVGQIVRFGLVSLASAAMVAEAGVSSYVAATPTTAAVALVGGGLIDLGSLIHSTVDWSDFRNRRQLLITSSLGSHHYSPFGGPGVEAWRTPGFLGVGYEYRMGLDRHWGAFFGGSFGWLQENQLNRSFDKRQFLQQEGGLYWESLLLSTAALELRQRFLGSAGWHRQHLECSDECRDLVVRIPDEDYGSLFRPHVAYRFGVGAGADLVFRRFWVLGGSVQLHFGPHSNFTGRSPIVGSSARGEVRIATGLVY